MCFSAEASFGASALLTVVGTIAVIKAKTNPQRLFASIPFVFAAQQFSEGLLWLSFKDIGLIAWQPFLTHTFLVFATMVWPVWIPFTLRLLEKDFKRKKIITWLLLTGCLVSVGIGFIMLFYPVHVVALYHHLHYSFDLPASIKKFTELFSLLYFATTIITTFISRIKRVKWLGIVFLASYNVSIIFYSDAVVSVWCYFAALMSFVVLWIIAGLRKDQI